MQSYENIFLECKEDILKLKEQVDKPFHIIFLANTVKSYIDRPVSSILIPTIYIGTLNKSKESVLGSLAHELGHLSMPIPNLRNKFYYNWLLRITGSNIFATKYFNLIRNLSLIAIYEEAVVDKKGIKILKSANLSRTFMQIMLKDLLRSDQIKFVNKISVAIRFLIIKILEIKICFHLILPLHNNYINI